MNRRSLIAAMPFFLGCLLALGARPVASPAGLGGSASTLPRASPPIASAEFGTSVVQPSAHLMGSVALTTPPVATTLPRRSRLRVPRSRRRSSATWPKRIRWWRERSGAQSRRRTPRRGRPAIPGWCLGSTPGPCEEMRTHRVEEFEGAVLESGRSGNMVRVGRAGRESVFTWNAREHEK
jgi:hypothetical protein